MTKNETELVTCLIEAIEHGHVKYCSAVKGPKDETWTVEEDCNCWVKKAKEVISKVCE